MFPKRVLTSFALILTSFVATAQSGLPPGLDQYIEKVVKTFEVPGLSVSIVKDGKVLLAKGYGVKKLNTDDRVDGNTLFSIASNSKAFTGTALALLIEEGKLKWDDRVIQHLPWFKMGDNYITTNLTVRDLLVHQSGLLAYSGDLMLFPPSTFSRREILEKVQKLPLAYDFRSTYAYDNILYLACAEIIKAVSGQEWEDFVKSRIFDKVGMPGSVSRYSEFGTRPNISFAHNRINGKITLVDDYLQQNTGDASNAAGGILSNANDISNWMITQLDSGRTPSGLQLFKPATTRQLWNIIRPIPISKVSERLKPAQMDFWGYASGFRAYNYQKHKVVGHGGKLAGFVSQVAMVPDLKLGVTVFTNQESTGAYWAIIYHVIDFYARNDKFDWINAFKEEQEASFARLKDSQQKSVVQADPDGLFNLPISKLAGNYRDAVYGDVSLKPAGDGMSMEFKNLPHFNGTLKYYQYNTFISTLKNRSLKGDAYVTFSLNPDGTVDQVKMKIIDPDSDHTYQDVLLKPVK
ncbi:serine hydrolase [Daejeonella lutea]|uniref:CubicO group peptidase, beta-lactamase class C family n=1 Tax=Daejeonella lutea TaxID=572036 RepID=A0A1T5F831_9SPHI|nr:serine hydrolase [Daejeonella lutea]SKB92304.1 CubicO group peptidase, beta-lactamase class C family [Daejeonella lutea]